MSGSDHSKNDGEKASDPVVRSFTQDGVETYEASIEGETIQWDKHLTYGHHLQIDQLLSAQRPVSDKPDEMLFIIMHQTMELWLKLMLHETRVAIAELRADELRKSAKTLARLGTIVRHMVHSWDVLATLTPPDFLTFRGVLSKASGFQSRQYRELEFLLGTKRADLILVHKDDAGAQAQLTKTLEEPSLYDEVLQVLARAGLQIPADKLERDWSQPYTPDRQVEAAWLTIYSDTETHWDLYRLGEQVTELEYYFQEWRFKHMKTVSRVIGQKMGTGGSSGVGYLIKALDLHFFPELWSMRTRMEAGPSQ